MKQSDNLTEDKKMDDGKLRFPRGLYFKDAANSHKLMTEEEGELATGMTDLRMEMNKKRREASKCKDPQQKQKLIEELKELHRQVEEEAKLLPALVEQMKQRWREEPPEERAKNIRINP